MLTKDYKKFLDSLNGSKVIAFPTETVMGLGVFFDDKKAYDLLNDVKRRPEDKPYTMMLGNIEDVAKYAHLCWRDLRLINKFMPGPLTILVNSRENVPAYVTHDTGVIGVRVPGDDDLLDLLRYLQKPLLVPSANRSGEKPCLTAREVDKAFGKEVETIFDKDALGQKPSTIIDLTRNEIKVVREGPISLEDINWRMRHMKIALGSDHGGYDAKEEVKSFLLEKGYEVIDCGTNSKESCHYPIYGEEVAKKVASLEADFGVVICTSGEGIAIAANKVKGIRCGIGYNDEVSKLMRQHNDANVISFGAAFMSVEDIKRRVEIFLNTDFEGGRHQTRVELIEKL